MRRAALLAGALLSACGASACAPGRPAESATSAVQPTAGSAATALPLALTESTYGQVTIRTAPNATCSLEVHVASPELGDTPPRSVDAGTADASGSLTVRYPAPHLPPQTGRHVVRCGSGATAARVDVDFAIAAEPPPARTFTARIDLLGATEQAPGVTARPEPSLTAARDADVAALRKTLAAEWTVATRGLSTVRLVEAAPADIVLTVAVARTQSFLRKSTRDGSMAIFLFPADDRGTLSADNFVAVALHELGHIWCCSGPDASSDGHWATLVADPLLQGVDRFGLMNHPVTCLVFAAGIESCPNRFSDRELRTMGFTQIPAPPRSACVDSKNALLAQLGTLRDQLATAKAGLDASDASLVALAAQIRGLEAQYPNGMPPDVYATYRSLIDRYNAGVASARTALAAYNALVTQSNGLVDQVNRLLC